MTSNTKARVNKRFFNQNSEKYINIIITVQNTRNAFQAEMSALYEREGINQYAGCLPLLIHSRQVMALYQAISRTDG